jgi:hypothetical protein
MTIPLVSCAPKWKYELHAASRGQATEGLLDKGETSIEPGSLASIYLGDFAKLLPARTPFERLHVVIKDQAGNTVLDRAVDEAAPGSPSAFPRTGQA